jgi:dihydroorotase-like cyclic amidohydrolase
MEVLTAAIIAGGFTVIVAFINRADKTSRKEHAENYKALARIEQKIDGHVTNHEKY